MISTFAPSNGRSLIKLKCHVTRDGRLDEACPGPAKDMVARDAWVDDVLSLDPDVGGTRLFPCLSLQKKEGQFDTLPRVSESGRRRETYLVSLR